MANPGASGGIDPAELKKMLIRSKKEPVNCAVGMDKNQQALIMLHRTKQPRALVKELEKTGGDLKNPRWGSAFVDVDDNPKLVILTLNKSAPGLARKMKTTLKGTGFSKVRVVLEDGTVDEAVEDDEDDDDAGATQQAKSGRATDGDATVDANHDDAVTTDATTAADAPAQPAASSSAAQPAGSEPNAQDVTQRLTALVKRMMAVIAKDPTQKAGLVELATDAQASLKRGDLAQAAAATDLLQQAVEGSEGGAASSAGAAKTGDGAAAATNGAATAPDPAASAPADASAAASNGASAAPGVRPADTPAGKNHAKARQAWLATRAKMTASIDDLSKSLDDAFKDHEKAAELQKAFKDKIDGVLGDLDEELAHKLDEINQAEDAETHTKIVGEARTILSRYESTVNSSPVIAALDKNPFVPLSLQKTITSTLSTLRKVL
jgi:hypothetical protein